MQFLIWFLICPRSSIQFGSMGGIWYPLSEKNGKKIPWSVYTHSLTNHTLAEMKLEDSFSQVYCLLQYNKTCNKVLASPTTISDWQKLAERSYSRPHSWPFPRPSLPKPAGIPHWGYSQETFLGMAHHIHLSHPKHRPTSINAHIFSWILFPAVHQSWPCNFLSPRARTRMLYVQARY